MWSLTGPGDLPPWPLVKAKAAVPFQRQRGLSSLPEASWGLLPLHTQASWGRTPNPALQIRKLRLTKVMGQGGSRSPIVSYTVAFSHQRLNVCLCEPWAFSRP